MTDTIADLLTRIRNAIGARQTKVDVPASRLKIEIARILKEEGYVTNYSVKTSEGSHARTLRIFLRYGPQGESVISHLERVSRPSRRVYVPGGEIGKVLGGLGVNILSTSQGVMTGRQARRARIGGEVLCNIY
ncbi:MAG TPA: 30S ribosomal protein S8 [Blastocatellia bacterium]|jgi:small subunit ribosomal protein S8|nr:30S ribosomal protein S8 [Blastocatellia bacterium]